MSDPFQNGWVIFGGDFGDPKMDAASETELKQILHAYFTAFQGQFPAATLTDFVFLSGITTIIGFAGGQEIAQYAGHQIIDWMETP